MAQTIDQVQECTKYCRDQVQAVQDMRHERAETWEQCKRMTDGYKDDPKYPWMSCIPITDAHDAVTRIAAQYSSDVEFMADPRPDESGELTDDDMALAKLAAGITNYYGQQGGLSESLDVVKLGLPTYGTQYIKVDYCTKTETKAEKKKRLKLYPSRKKKTNTGIEGVESKEEEYEVEDTKISEEKIRLYVPSVFDIYIRPDADGVQEAPCVAERKIEDLRDLKNVAKERGYENVDQLEAGVTRDTDGANYTSDTLRQYDFTTDNDELGKNEVELFEYWGKLKKSWVSGKKSDKEWIEGYILFGNGKKGKTVILKSGENPYGGIRPYVRFIYKRSPEAHRLLGIGAIEPVRGYYDMKGKLIDMLMDNGKMTWMNGYAIKPHVKASQLKPRPRMVVRTADPQSDIRPLEVKDITGPILKAIDIAEDNIRRGTGVTDLQMGVEGGDTALETGIMQDNAAIFWQDVRRNYMRGLDELGNMIWQIVLHKKTDTSDWVQVWDDEKSDYEYISWTPADFENKKFQLSVQAQSILHENNAVKANQMIKFVDVFGEKMQLSPDEYRLLGKSWMNKQGLEQEADELDDDVAPPPPPEPPMPPMGPPPGPAAGPMPMTQEGIQQAPQAGIIPPMQ